VPLHRAAGCRSESIRTGFLLSQGGEFAFVLLSLACQVRGGGAHVTHARPRHTHGSLPLRMRLEHCGVSDTCPAASLRLAPQLKVLPEELNQILIIIVVASMALTPTLADVGSRLADAVEAAERATTSDDELSGRVAPVLDVSVCCCPWALAEQAMCFVCSLHARHHKRGPPHARTH
jgi:Kef-type K+ transport system membrane component KefB